MTLWGSMFMNDTAARRRRLGCVGHTDAARHTGVGTKVSSGRRALIQRLDLSCLNSRKSALDVPIPWVLCAVSFLARNRHR